MKFVIRLSIFLSLLFLFGGLLSVGIFGDNNTIKNSSSYSSIFYTVKPTPRLTIQQIDSISAASNYHFTVANAQTSNYYPKSNIQ
ncbi:MAG TPA: hypothetical protein VMV32_12265 [Ignavibacteriaceae bacterium]|nr:hypothetical protein [Ignavibacteriaceae bacterium]